MHFIIRNILSIATILLLLAVLAFSILSSVIRGEQRNLPDIKPIVNYNPLVHTTVYSENGDEVFKFGQEKRNLVAFKEIPRQVINAIIAAEDQNFWNHKGYDPQAIIRAAMSNFSSGSVVSGASTITQQLTKNIILSPERSISRKIQEILIATEVEKVLGKEEILERYLNEIYLGRGAFGISMASELYFGKKISNLNLSEIAYLAILPKAPSFYEKNPERALVRRLYVLNRMLDLGFITKQEKEKANSDPIKIIPKIKSGEKQGHFIQAALPQIKNILGDDFIGKKKYDIRLTLNPSIQDIVVNSLRTGIQSYDIKRGVWNGPINDEYVNSISDWQIATIFIDGKTVMAKTSRHSLPMGKTSLDWVRRSKKRLINGDRVLVEIVKGQPELRQIPKVQGSAVVMNVENGDVLALTGAFSEDDSFFNRAVMAKRQPGSVLKPFIYGVALENGWRPDSPILDSSIALDAGAGQETWRPKDHGYSDTGFVTLRSGLIKSRNTVSLRLFESVGASKIQDALSTSGIYKNPPSHSSMALGAMETTLLNVVSGYTALAGDGSPKKPNFIKEIKEGSIDITIENNPEDISYLFDEITRTQLRSMLNGVTTYGTARRAFSGYDGVVYGKTGTTNNARDVWFVGFNANVVIGVYIGFDDPKSLGKGVAGGNTAAPIVRSVFDSMPGKLKEKKYTMPEGIKKIRVNKETGLPDPDGIIELIRE